MTRKDGLAFTVLGLGACISIACAQSLKPATTGAYAFWALWLALPHGVLAAALLRSRRKGRFGWRAPVIAMLVSLAGPIFLADAIVWNPDAQGALAVLLTPIFQAGLGVILLAGASLASRLWPKSTAG